MHKFFVALILLSVPVSTSALAQSGTEQDERTHQHEILMARNPKWPKISPRSPASDLRWPIARRTNRAMAVPWLSAICAAPNERDIASGATVEFKSTSARSHRRREKFVRTRNENAFLHKALHRAPITSGSQEIHSKLFADRRSMLSQHSAL